MPPTIERIDIVYRGWLRISEVALRDEAGPFRREVEHHGDGAGVLPYDPVRRLATVIRLPRTPLLVSGEAEDLIEAPAGLIDPGEDPAESARREALEEAGLRLGALEPLGAIWTMPGISTERMHLFLAPYTEADKVAAGGGLADEHENIRIEERPLAELARLADAMLLTDIRVLLMVQTLRLRHPALFT